MEFTGTVKSVEVKKSKAGKTYYRLNIPQDGKDRWHSSFDAKAVELQGETINFDASQTQYGWNLDEYEIAPQAPASTPAGAPASAPAEHSYTNRSNRENVWIATQGMIFRGIEVGFFQSMTDALGWFQRAMPVLQAIWDEDEAKYYSLMEELQMDEMPDEIPETSGQQE